jgi:rhamnosyltransferase
MQGKEKIFALIVAYNPDINKLFKLVDFLKSQVSFIVIGNNSKCELSIENDKVKIFNFKQNLGIAAAQSIGMKWVFENGADFVLMLDQDSCPDPGSIDELISAYSRLILKGYNIGLIAMRDYDEDSDKCSKAIFTKGKKIDGCNCSMERYILSSGSLIPKKAYQKVGGMEDGLFIDSVDFEYCWRLQGSGFLTVIDNDCMLSHRLGQGTKTVFGIIQLRVFAPFRHYYQFRNVLLLMKRNYAPFYWKISNFIKLILKLFVYPFVLDNGKERLKYMIHGIKDAIFNRYGKMSILP